MPPIHNHSLLGTTSERRAIMHAQHVTIVCRNCVFIKEPEESGILDGCIVHERESMDLLSLILL